MKTWSREQDDTTLELLDAKCLQMPQCRCLMCTDERVIASSSPLVLLSVWCLFDQGTGSLNYQILLFSRTLLEPILVIPTSRTNHNSWCLENWWQGQCPTGFSLRSFLWRLPGTSLEVDDLWWLWLLSLWRVCLAIWLICWWFRESPAATWKLPNTTWCYNALKLELSLHSLQYLRLEHSGSGVEEMDRAPNRHLWKEGPRFAAASYQEPGPGAAMTPMTWRMKIWCSNCRWFLFLMMFNVWHWFNIDTPPA